MIPIFVLFLSSGICGAVQNNFVVTMKRRGFFIPVAICFASVIAPYLFLENAAACLFATAAIVALSTGAGCLFYEGFLRFRLYNLLLQHIITLSSLFMADALSNLFGGANQLLLQSVFTLALNLIWVGSMYYAHIRIFTLIPLEEDNYRQALWYCGYALVILMFAIVVRKGVGFYGSSPKMGFAILAFLSACAVFAMILALLWNSTAMPKMLMEKQLQAITLQNTLLTLRIQDEIVLNNRLKEIRHDHRSHLTALSGLLESGQAVKAQAMLRELIDRSTQPRGEVYCDNSLINVILHDLAEKCKKLGAKLEYTIRLPQKLFISDTDLTALLMNITNNAAECCQTLLEPSKAFIRITIYISNEYFVVKCENTIDFVPQISNNRILSTKQDPGHEHGIGLESIHHICKRYNGSVTLKADYPVFTITALLQNKAVV